MHVAQNGAGVIKYEKESNKCGHDKTNQFRIEAFQWWYPIFDLLTYSPMMFFWLPRGGAVLTSMGRFVKESLLPPCPCQEVKLWLWARSRASRRNRGSGGSRVCARARNRLPPRTRASFLLRGNASSLVRRCRRWAKRLAGGPTMGPKIWQSGPEQ